MNLGEYIKAYRAEHGISQRQFATMIGMSNGYVSMLEKGANPSTGEPIMPTLASLKTIADTMGITIDDLFKNVDDINVSMKKPSFEPVHYKKMLPLVGNIACGTPILASENVEKEIGCPEDIDADFCLRCRGDSMTGARIFDGDIVYVRSQDDVNDGQIAVVCIPTAEGEAEATLKRVYHNPDGSVTLMAENPAYRPLVLRDARIEGLAVAFTSLIR